MWLGSGLVEYDLDELPPIVMKYVEPDDNSDDAEQKTLAC